MGNEVNVGVLSAILRLKDELTPAMQGVTTRLSSVGDTVSTISKQVAGMFAAHELTEGIRNIAEGVGDIVERGSKIADLSQRMGVSAEAFQQLAFAAKQGGAPLEAVSVAMKTLSSQLADGKLPDALTKMGISFEDIKRSTPEATLMAAFQAIAKLPDPLNQSAAAVMLLGRNGQTLLPAIRDGFAEVAKSAPVMSNATVAALDAMGDKWNLVQTRIHAVQAEALTPLLDAFSKLPLSVQTATGFLLMMSPALGNVGIAILAAGGPVAAFGMLSGAMTAIAGFVTVTLIPALVALAVPIAVGGAIVAGIVAIYEAWKHWDELKVIVEGLWTAVKTFLVDKWAVVKDTTVAALNAVADVFHSTKDKVVTYAQQVYEGVKHWLIDQFNTVVQAIKDKIKVVADSFAWLHDVVIGHSYVPDLINGIQKEFGRLDLVMVAPTITATTKTSDSFKGMFDNVSGMLKGFTGGAMTSWMGEMSQFLGPRIGGAVSKFQGLMGDGFKMVTGIAKIFAGDFSGVMDTVMAGIHLVQAAWSALKNAFASDETKFVNKPRDEFFAQFGGYDGLAKQLTEAFGKQGDPNSGTDADNLIKQLYAADNKEKYDAATAAIMAVINGGGYTPGATGGASTPSQKAPFDPNIDIAADPNFVPQFATGTGGRFLDFGKGTLAMLHGRERVMKEGEGGGGLSITVNVSGGTVIGNSDDFRQSVTKAVLDGLERGGGHFTKFRTLTAQAVG